MYMYNDGLTSEISQCHFHAVPRGQLHTHCESLSRVSIIRKSDLKWVISEHCVRYTSHAGRLYPIIRVVLTIWDILRQKRSKVIIKNVWKTHLNHSRKYNRLYCAVLSDVCPIHIHHHTRLETTPLSSGKEIGQVTNQWLVPAECLECRMRGRYPNHNNYLEN